MPMGSRPRTQKETLECVQNLVDVDGPFQSPININFRDLTRIDLPPLCWNKSAVIPKRMKVTNSGQTVILTAKWHCDRPYLTGGPLEGKYVFSQVHFHWGPNDCKGSEHTVDGESFPLEMHVVHFKADYMTQECALKERDGMVVLVYLFKIMECPSLSMQRLVSALPCIRQAHTAHHIDPCPIVTLCHPFTDDYFMYWGSLVTSTCAHVILFLVCREPLGASSEQVYTANKDDVELTWNGSVEVCTFRTIKGTSNRPIKRNNRDTKPLHNRTVFHVNSSPDLDNALLPVRKHPGCFCPSGPSGLGLPCKNNCRCLENLPGSPAGKTRKDSEGEYNPNREMKNQGPVFEITSVTNTFKWQEALWPLLVLSNATHSIQAATETLKLSSGNADNGIAKTVSENEVLCRQQSALDGSVVSNRTKGMRKKVSQVLSKDSRRRLQRKRKKNKDESAESKSVDRSTESIERLKVQNSYTVQAMFKSLQDVEARVDQKTKEIEQLSNDIIALKSSCGVHKSKMKRLSRLKMALSRDRRLMQRSSEHFLCELNQLVSEYSIDNKSSPASESIFNILIEDESFSTRQQQFLHRVHALERQFFEVMDDQDETGRVKRDIEKMLGMVKLLQTAEQPVISQKQTPQGCFMEDKPEDSNMKLENPSSGHTSTEVFQYGSSLDETQVSVAVLDSQQSDQRNLSLKRESFFALPRKSDGLTDPPPETVCGKKRSASPLSTQFSDVSKPSSVELATGSELLAAQPPGSTTTSTVSIPSAVSPLPMPLVKPEQSTESPQQGPKLPDKRKGSTIPLRMNNVAAMRYQAAKKTSHAKKVDSMQQTKSRSAQSSLSSTPRDSHRIQKPAAQRPTSAQSSLSSTPKDTRQTNAAVVRRPSSAHSSLSSITKDTHQIQKQAAQRIRSAQSSLSSTPKDIRQTKAAVARRPGSAQSSLSSITRDTYQIQKPAVPCTSSNRSRSSSPSSDTHQTRRAGNQQLSSAEPKLSKASKESSHYKKPAASRTTSNRSRSSSPATDTHLTTKTVDQQPSSARSKLSKASKVTSQPRKATALRICCIKSRSSSPAIDTHQTTRAVDQQPPKTSKNPSQSKKPAASRTASNRSRSSSPATDTHLTTKAVDQQPPKTSKNSSQSKKPAASRTTSNRSRSSSPATDTHLTTKAVDQQPPKTSKDSSQSKKPAAPRTCSNRSRSSSPSTGTHLTPRAGGLRPSSAQLSLSRTPKGTHDTKKPAAGPLSSNRTRSASPSSDTLDTKIAANQRSTSVQSSSFTTHRAPKPQARPLSSSRSSSPATDAPQTEESEVRRPSSTQSSSSKLAKDTPRSRGAAARRPSYPRLTPHTQTNESGARQPASAQSSSSSTSIDTFSSLVQDRGEAVSWCTKKRSRDSSIAKVLDTIKSSRLDIGGDGADGAAVDAEEEQAQGQGRQEDLFDLHSSSTYTLRPARSQPQPQSTAELNVSGSSCVATISRIPILSQRKNTYQMKKAKNFITVNPKKVSNIDASSPGCVQDKAGKKSVVESEVYSFVFDDISKVSVTSAESKDEHQVYIALTSPRAPRFLVESQQRVLDECQRQAARGGPEDSAVVENLERLIEVARLISNDMTLNMVNALNYMAGLLNVDSRGRAIVEMPPFQDSLAGGGPGVSRWQQCLEDQGSPRGATEDGSD